MWSSVLFCSHLFVGSLCDTEQEEEEPDEADAHHEAQRHHGDDRGIWPRPAPQSHRQELIGWEVGQLVYVSVLSQSTGQRHRESDVWADVKKKTKHLSRSESGLLTLPVGERCESKCHWDQVPKDLITNPRSVEIDLRTEGRWGRRGETSGGFNKCNKLKCFIFSQEKKKILLTLFMIIPLISRTDMSAFLQSFPSHTMALTLSRPGLELCSQGRCPCRETKDT